MIRASVFQKLRMLLIAAIGNAIIMVSVAAQQPELSDLVDHNSAFVKLDKINTSIGSAIGMHFISTVTINGTIWAYYIKGERVDAINKVESGVGLAKSTDGINFSDYGLVLPVGEIGSWDDRYASFPGVSYDHGIFYMVYEGAGSRPNFPGDIGLATSTDGIHFTKRGVILTHNKTGWESINIGTPSLLKQGKHWYLFYHGFDGKTCQVGVATGTNLTSLVKYSGNPIIPSIPNTWQAGTVGRRGILKDKGKYYMVYEGSGVQPYGTASWASGLASSTDLLHWTIFSQNPVLPLTQKSMGDDGPTFLNIAGNNYIYYRVTGAINSTRRALITNEKLGGFDLKWDMTDSHISHKIGKLDADGWSVNVSDHPDYMQFGPYVPLVPGDQISTWKMMIDNNNASDDKIVRLEVVDDDDKGHVLEQRDITRNEWKRSNHYEYFSIPFHLDANRAGHRIELRVWWYGKAYVKEQLVGIS